MNSVGRKKSTPKAAAAPSSTSSRKRRSKHQNASRSKAKRVDNTTKHGGVDTSNEINTRSNQKDKNDYGLDPSSNLSNYNKTATNNNKNNNVSKSWNVTHIKRTLVEVHRNRHHRRVLHYKIRNKYYYQVLFVATATTTVKILEVVLRVLNQFYHPRLVRSPLVIVGV